MKVLLIALIAMLSINNAFSQTNFNEKSEIIDSLMLNHLVHKGKRPIYNILLYAKNEKTGYEYFGGQGSIGKRNEKRVEADYQYRIASITKTVVATIVLQLEEEGKLNVNDKAYSYLDGLDFLNFDEFLILNNTSYAKDIRIKDLLQHTSGIADIFTDKKSRFNISVFLNKKRQFTPEGLVDIYYKYNLNKEPNNKPGESMHYSDMNYMLLGFIIEQVTKQKLPQVIRDRIIEKLGMNNTYFEYYEKEYGNGKRVDTYLNRINMTKKINSSYEWAGGGLVSTTKDVAIFIEALFNNELFQNSSTLDKMIDFSDNKKYGLHYGMGISLYKFNDKLFYGHGGYYGSLLIHEPIDNITLSINVGQVKLPSNNKIFMKNIMDVIMNE
ncbi:MAG: hypothetical protein A2W99_15025 [Bacteroidetes bacterium GWF2_33_16]|nr:MAG: hypothetical protein A2X00_00060 [Bacteroidetes bacterium GWE2_32_14]OFY07638.1 MAG: hypothetical protein A2W99_15025 [Bacteroidetes bacterium GWF2_33_16]